MIETLDHLMVRVADLDLATARTAALLGRAPSWRGAHPAMGTANSLFRVDNTYLELIAPVAEGVFAEQLRRQLDERGEGVHGLAFGTANLAATLAVLRANGLQVSDAVAGAGRDEHSGAQRQWLNAFVSTAASRGLLVFLIEHRDPAEALPLVTPEDPAASIQALDHVVVQSRDIEATRALYAEQLGLRLALKRSFDARGLHLLFFRVGGCTVEVVGRIGDAPQPEAADRFGGLAWQVADIDAAHARLGAAGFDLSPVRDGFKPGTRVCTIRDAPGAVPTLLIQPVTRA